MSDEEVLKCIDSDHLSKASSEVLKIIQTSTFLGDISVMYKRISKEVVSFLMTYIETTPKSELDIRQVAASAATEILRQRSKKDFNNFDDMTIKEIFKKMLCDCIHGEYGCRDESQIGMTISERNRKLWKTVAQRKAEIEKKGKHIEELQEYLHVKTNLSLEAKSLEQSLYSDTSLHEFDEETEYIERHDTSQIVMTPVSQAETDNTLFKYDRDSDFDVTLQQQQKYSYIESIVELGEKVKDLYLNTQGDKLNEFLEIKQFAVVFVDEIIEIALERLIMMSRAKEWLVDDGGVEEGGVEEDGVEVSAKEVSVKEVSVKEITVTESSIEVNRSLNDRLLKIEIQDFTPRLGQKAIDKFINTWELHKNWCYCINYICEQTDSTSDFYRYEVIWSIPSEKYPIPQATASVYFTIEVSRIIPLRCPVKITYCFEGYNYIYTLDAILKHEKFLDDIQDSKLAIFKSITF